MRRVALLVVLGLGGCKHNDDWQGLVETTVLPVGDEDCPQGGTRIDAGLDDGLPGGTAGDGELQADEIDSTTTECDGLTGHAVVAAIGELDPGDASCPFGGHRVDYGHDDGLPTGTADDGVLQAGEIEDHTDACFDAADGLLVVTSELAWGDDDCPTGGRHVDYGIDDGLPGGTAGDGLLDSDEIDGTDVVCHVEVTDKFAPIVPGTAGTEAISVAGGAGTTGGNGGQLEVWAYGGALDTAIVVRQDEAVAIALPAPTPTIDLGASPLQVTSATAITVWDGTGGEPATPHVRESEEDVPRTLYVGSVAVTGVHIAPGVTLTMPVAGSTSLRFDADIHNEGTLLVPEVTPDHVGVLVVRCDDFVNGVDGLVDLRADVQSGTLMLLAIAGPDSSIVNLGRIRANSENQPTPGQAGELTLLARGEIYNSGGLFVRGGTSGNSTAPGASGGTLTLLAPSGAIENAGTFHVQGGNGTVGGAGGTVKIGTGLPNEAIQEYSSIDEAVSGIESGPGGYVQTGQIDAYGGVGATAGGRGGDVTIDARGGDTLLGGGISVAGGTALVSGTGGIGGELDLLATALLDGDQLYRPEQVAVQASLDGSGGDGPTGGNAGSVRLIAELTLTSTNDFSTSIPYTDAPYALATLYGQGSLTLVLAGLGGGIEAGAGDGGIGGSVRIRGGSCLGDSPGCAIPHTGVRWLYNDVDVRASAAPGGYGGYVELEISEGPNELHAVTDGKRLENHGALDLAGPDDADIAGSGGSVWLAVDAGDLVNTVPLDLSAGDGSDEGRWGGVATLSGYTIDQQGTIDTSGGSGGTSDADAGAIEIHGGTVSIAGDLVADGGSPTGSGAVSAGRPAPIRISAVDLTLVGDVSSRTSSVSGTGEVNDAGGEGFIEIAAATASITGTLDASTGDQVNVTSCSHQYGGEVYLFLTTSLGIEGAIAAAGSGCESSTGDAWSGPGGYVSVRAPLVTGDLDLRIPGGRAVAPAGYDAQAGGGGYATIAVPGSPITVDCTGGDASAPSTATAGGGGYLEYESGNTGAITCRGGDATGPSPTGGYGGYIEIDGDNSGCIDVGGGAPSGPAGEVVVSGIDTGTCS